MANPAWAEFGGICPVYMQVGYFPNANFSDEERERVTALCQELCSRLQERGLHPARFEFRGNLEYHSAFIYLADDQPNWERVEQIIAIISEEKDAVFGKDSHYRFRHRFWRY